MRRVLQIVSTMDYGGAETLLMSLYRKIDRTKLQFDFLCLNRTEARFSEEIYSLGGRMFKVDGPRHIGLRGYCRQLHQFFSQHPEYWIVHSHLNFDSAFSLWMAKKAGVPYRISHSHIASLKCSLPYRLYTYGARFLNDRSLTDRFACSDDAGKYLYGNNVSYHILPNAIDTARFRFDESQRRIIRKQLQVDENQFLLGHIGRFSPPKNHLFLLRLFAEMVRKEPRCKLVLLGAGPLEQAAHSLVEELGLQEKVFFAGLQSDTQAYYAAMDLFLFPSIYEGLGIVAVEAQCSGVPVIASSMVPSFAKVTDLMQFVSLDAPLADWCDIILRNLSSSTEHRLEYAQQVSNSPYNLDKVAAFLQDYYLGLKQL